MSLIIQFKDVKRDDIIKLGERLYLFCELANNKIQVPNSFIITNETLVRFLEETGLTSQISELVDSISYRKEELEALAIKIQDLILNSEMPHSIFNDIKTAYENMAIHNDIFRSASIQTIDFIKAGRTTPYLAVRPFLKKNKYIEHLDNIKGIDSLIAAVKRVFALYFNSETIINDNINDLSIIVQKMTNPDKSVFVTLNNDNIIINACFGTSDPMRSNEINFDTYILDRNNLQLKEYKINKQEWMLYRDENLLRTVRRNLFMRGDEQKLNYNEIEKLVEACNKLKEFVDSEYRFEFVFENNRVYLINIENINESKEEQTEDSQNFSAAFEALEQNPITTNTSNLISGLRFYSGKASGNVKIIRSLDDVTKVNYNDIVVCRFVKPEFIGAIEKASAIVADADIASEIEELIKVPCIINSNNATQLLNDNDYVSVDADSGVISKIEKKEQEKQKDAEVPFKFDIKIDENTDVESLIEKIKQVKEFLKK